MMVTGNILLLLAGMIYLSMSSILFSRQEPPRGDYGVGFAWTLMMGNFAFTLCLSIVVAIIGWQGGFSWVSVPGVPRVIIVTGCYILIMLGYNFFAMKEGAGDLPLPLRQIVSCLPGVLPPVLLACAVILLNDELRGSVPVAVYQWPLMLAAVPGLVALGLNLHHSARNAAARREDALAFAKRNHQAHLDRIDAADIQTALATILVFTDAYKEKEVRERALTKIRSRADWQEELVRLLETGWAPEVFTFLASNEVNDKALLAPAVETGVRVQARLIRESIRRCRGSYDLYSGRFLWEVDRVLRTIQKFRDQGVDYRPAVQELRKALDERTQFEKPKLHCIPVLDKWLKKN